MKNEVFQQKDCDIHNQQIPLRLEWAFAVNGLLMEELFMHSLEHNNHIIISYMVRTYFL